MYNTHKATKLQLLTELTTAWAIPLLVSPDWEHTQSFKVRAVTLDVMWKLSFIIITKLIIPVLQKVKRCFCKLQSCLLSLTAQTLPLHYHTPNAWTSSSGSWHHSWARPHASRSPATTPGSRGVFSSRSVLPPLSSTHISAWRGQFQYPVPPHWSYACSTETPDFVF